MILTQVKGLGATARMLGELTTSLQWEERTLAASHFLPSVALYRTLPFTPQVKELDAKARMLGELTTTLQREERALAASQHESASLRGHLQTLERELRNAQVGGGVE